MSFDELLRPALSSIINNTVRLPIKFGGLRIRRVSSLALPAFLASAASKLRSTVVLRDEILGGSQPLSDSLAESLKVAV